MTREVLHHVVGEVDRAFFTRETEGELPVSRMDRESLDRARRMRSEMTRAEVILWTRLQRRQLLGYQFKRQKKIGPYYADFACSAAMLVVEVDGATHSSAEERAYDAARCAVEDWSPFVALRPLPGRSLLDLIPRIKSRLRRRRSPPPPLRGHLPRLRRWRTSPKSWKLLAKINSGFAVRPPLELSSYCVLQRRQRWRVLIRN